MLCQLFCLRRMAGSGSRPLLTLAVTLWVWTGRPVQSARARVEDKVALQGNMDPSILYAQPEVIRAEVQRILRDYGAGPGHVFNLGHGISPGVDPKHVAVFVQQCTNFPLLTSWSPLRWMSGSALEVTWRPKSAPRSRLFGVRSLS